MRKHLQWIALSMTLGASVASHAGTIACPDGSTTAPGRIVCLSADAPTDRLLGQGSYIDFLLGTILVNQASYISSSVTTPLTVGSVILVGSSSSAPSQVGVMQNLYGSPVTATDRNYVASFDRVAAGEYQVLVGTFSANGVIPSGIMASMQIIPAIPEPETYALMIAGLLAMSFVANRRKVS